MTTTKTFTVKQLAKMGNPKNPRWMPESQLDALTQSLQEFGLVEPIIVNTRTNQIVGGHQRVAAAQKAGYENLEAVIIDVTPEKELALNLLLNKVKGDWDYDKLAECLSELSLEDFNVTGFSQSEAEAIIQSIADEGEALLGNSGVISEIRNKTDEEVEEELESTSKTQFGMFSRHITNTEYKQWVERLENLSEQGTSPAALGLVVAQMLGLETLQEEQEEIENDEDE